MSDASTPREGVPCPFCGHGDWNLTVTRSKRRRGRCCACRRVFVVFPEDKGGPRMPATDPARVAAVERALAAGVFETGQLAAVGQVSRWMASKLRRKWLARWASAETGC